MSGPRRFARAGSVALAALLLLGVSSACGARHRHMRHHGFGDDRESVQVVSALVGGKNVYIPGTIVLTAGSGRKLTIFNATDTPHGFRIAALGVETILNPGVDTVVELPPLTGHAIHQIDCQLHPPHRHATLVVLPAKR